MNQFTEMAFHLSQWNLTEDRIVTNFLGRCEEYAFKGIPYVLQTVNFVRGNHGGSGSV